MKSEHRNASEIGQPVSDNTPVLPVNSMINHTASNPGNARVGVLRKKNAVVRELDQCFLD